jgi:AP-4 complex subunit epsilon-1
MLGYDVSFAYIHAVKLAQQGTILEKRIGMYCTCCIFMSQNVLNCIVSAFPNSCEVKRFIKLAVAVLFFSTVDYSSELVWSHVRH